MDSEKVSQTFNGLVSWDIGGSYFKLMSTVSPVGVTLRKDGRIVHQAAGVEGGHYQRIPFNKVEITTSALELVSWLYAPDQGGSDRFTGTFALTGPAIGVTYTPATKTATSASSTMLAANAGRKVLKVQVQSGAVNSIFLHLNGGTAIADATCWEILPGQSWEPIVPPLGAITMIRNGAVDVPFHVEEG